MVMSKNHWRVQIQHFNNLSSSSSLYFYIAFLLKFRNEHVNTMSRYLSWESLLSRCCAKTSKVTTSYEFHKDHATLIVERAEADQQGDIQVTKQKWCEVDEIWCKYIFQESCTLGKWPPSGWHEGETVFLDLYWSGKWSSINVDTC